MLNHFIIASMQRSGTTVLKTLLASHPEISSNQEVLKTFVFKREEGIALIEGLPRDSNCKALGFKLMLNQIDSNDWVMDYLSENNYRVIILHRRPLIDIFLSHEIAKRDNRWAVNSDVEVKPIQIDLDDMEKQMKIIHENQLRLDQLFQSFTVFKMTYRSVNSEDHHSKLLNFLGVNSYVKLRSNQRKVLRKSRENYISNYSGVKEHIAKLGLDN